MTNSNRHFYFSKSVFLIPIVVLAILWLVFIYGFLFDKNLYQYGILPQTYKGLRGIPLHIFLHGNWQHLINNSTPILVLLMALRFFYRSQFFIILLIGVFFTGLFTWLIGENNYHIGISGLIYFLVSFMFFKGLLSKYFRLIALSLLIAVFYGSLVWYMFPSELTSNQAISWEGHLSGFVVGLALANFLKTPSFNKEEIYDWQKPGFKPELDPFVKNFDEQGNFVVQKTPPIEEESDVFDYFKSSIKVIYNFLGKKV